MSSILVDQFFTTKTKKNNRIDPSTKKQETQRQKKKEKKGKKMKKQKKKSKQKIFDFLVQLVHHVIKR